jgi:tetratricopeptide (TPR) repeat protein
VWVNARPRRGGDDPGLVSGPLAAAPSDPDPSASNPEVEPRAELGKSPSIPDARSDGSGLGRAAVDVLKTEWKYVLVGLMILFGHFKYHLSLLYYAHELAHAQQEHMLADEQREASAQVVKHHVDLGNSLFGDGEMRGAESEFREALKVDPTNLDAQRGLFKASIFDEVDDDTNTRSASPVVILSRIRELVCEVQEAACVGANGVDDAPPQGLHRASCEAQEWQCIKQRQGEVPLTGTEGAHARLLEGMALASVDPAASLAALREAVVLADGHPPEEGSKSTVPTNLAAAYIRIGDYYLGSGDEGSLPKAIAAYETALRATPWNINALDSVGYALHRMGQWDAAREKFLYLGRLDDTLMIAHADLARTLRGLGASGTAHGALLDEAYEEQLELVSLLSAKPEPATRDTVSQWQYPVAGRVYDLHEKPAKLAYATCAMSLTGHLRGLPDTIGICQRAIADHALTSDQQQTVRDFVVVELEELLGLPTGDPSLKKRATAFKVALEKMP